MKNFVKILCVTLALVMAVSLASCSLTKQYSYKTDDAELPIGVYIYSLYSAYNQAESLAQQSDLYDSEAGAYDGKKSFLKMEITDNDGKTATADEWIYDTADKTMKNILAVYNQFNALGCTVDEATVSQYEEAAKMTWEHGPYYQYYGAQYDSPYSAVYEPLGVSYDSFYLATYYAGLMQEQVFNALYGADGVEAVSDDELTDYFTGSYTSYKFFSAPLYTSEEVASTDDDGNETTENVDASLSDEEIAAYEDAFKGYVSDIADGVSYDEMIAAYMESYEIESDPSQSGVEIMADSTIGADLVAEIEALKEGEASYKIIGEGDARTIYFFYKEPISSQIENYIGDETQREQLLNEYKTDDFNDYLEEIGENLDITVSSACKQVTPKKFEA